MNKSRKYCLSGTGASSPRFNHVLIACSLCSGVLAVGLQAQRIDSGDAVPRITKWTGDAFFSSCPAVSTASTLGAIICVR